MKAAFKTKMINPAKSRLARSKACHYFQELEGKNQAKCLLCGVVFTFHGHSSSLIRHIRKHHRQEAMAVGIDVSSVPENSSQTNVETEEMVTRPNLPARPGSRRTSKAWNYFRVLEGKNQAKCLLCCRDFPFHGHSSYLFRHIKKHHREEAMAVGIDVSSVPENSRQTFYEEMSLISSTEEIVTKSDPSARSRRTSKAWHYFQMLEGKNQAKCLLCCKDFPFHGHSSHLFRHIKRMHPQAAIALGIDFSLLPEVAQRRLKKMSLDSSTEGIAQTKPNSEFASHTITLPLSLPSQQKKGDDKAQSLGDERKKRLDEKLVAMIALDLQPVSFVENKGFVAFMNEADSTYGLPSQHKILNELLPNLYNSTAEVMKKKLEDAPKVALSTDLWCPGNRVEYLTLAAHFISLPDWRSHSITLSTSIFYGSYTGEDIANEIEQSVAKWNLTDKVAMMVTDTATNLLLAHENLPWGIIPCLAHLIHLVVSDAISEDMEVSSLIERAQDVVNFFYYNKEASQRLADMQQSLGMPEKKLAEGVIIRWDSIYNMFERLIEQFDSVNVILSKMGQGEKSLSSADKEMMVLTMASLKPFEIVAKTLSQDKGNANNIGMAMPLMEGLQKMMTSLKGPIMEPFTTSLKAGLVKRFEQMWDSEWIIAATLLDPRYKRFPFTNKVLQEKAVNNIVEEASVIMEVDQSMNEDVSEEDALWNYLDDDYHNENAQESKTIAPVSISEASREVHRYVDSPSLPRKECPLLYWKQHVELLPTLSQIALKYMCVPITSTSSEKFFSKASELLAEKKTQLKPQTLDMVLFLNKNLP